MLRTRFEVPCALQLPETFGWKNSEIKRRQRHTVANGPLLRDVLVKCVVHDSNETRSRPAGTRSSWESPSKTSIRQSQTDKTTNPPRGRGAAHTRKDARAARGCDRLPNRTPLLPARDRARRQPWCGANTQKMAVTTPVRARRVARMI